MSIAELYDVFRNSTGVTTDTRNVLKGQLFFALKGEKFNANSFASEALTAGAIAVIIDEPEYIINDSCILVPNVLLCLLELAQYHRRQFKGRIIGLTGSNGKTTNKELLARVLAVKYKVHATKGNFNNHIGVPLTLLGMPLDADFGIIEMGANHQKEIAMLSSICEPDFGFITNIGKAHLEGFGGPEGVKKGKGELFDFILEHRKIAFVNETDPVLVGMVNEKKLSNVVFYGQDVASLDLIQDSPNIVFQLPNGNKFECIISGKYNFDNMQTAFAVGRYFAVEDEMSAQAIASYDPDNNRSQIIEKGMHSFLMDAYNANPSSMEVAIINFGKLQTPKCKAVVLGDMFELGEFAAAEHDKLGELVAQQDFDIVVLYGENMKSALAHLPNAYYFTDKFSLHNWLVDKKWEPSYFLIKGSRGVGLESVLTVL